MLKLIIADDERVIRETISHLIDWNSIGIELIGLCKDGIEAYDMILDESPDIVLTDIRMPGLSGLELIQKISQTDLDTQFILLSGYGEFDYAKEAMKYGVRHYLLKPCNEEQIISSMKSVIEDCYHKRAFHRFQEQQKLLSENLHSNILTNIINEGVSLGYEGNYDQIYESYQQFIDFDSTAYQLYYLYFLEEHNLSSCLEYIKSYGKAYAPSIPIHGVYVNNTLLLFFQSYGNPEHNFDKFLDTLYFDDQAVSLSWEQVAYPNLSLLLDMLLKKISRYGTIYYINNFHPIPTCNYKNLIQQTDILCNQILTEDDKTREEAGAELKRIFHEITNPDFMIQLASSLVIRSSSKADSCTPVTATEFLLELNQEREIEAIRSRVLDKTDEILEDLAKKNERLCDFTEKIMVYVTENLSDPTLTLKWISENYLFMNVDYVSKKFIKETGMKFSTYLTEQRIKKAKELLSDGDSEKIHYVAEVVGCGNNPQYFSQIFKKNTGMTPSAYAKKMGSSK